ncbi:UDP-4-amino-4,6-dideoxy-N-acetyl-beta-L-altrosamine N-acetyltransferase [Anaeromusa acidaminophila]|uniref:UDP-4-amino-4, 6-dideoxy-N-acetyl-beta-L-altrosamine N-acetyltransferase n=1 Tax=Anaeromusa acidaminophila TaxID=81464 RepID=UPI000380A957|nr:UDP-4-amino-4,6-dideoxy-N-acetyl-beta-L-altrosamine N-acetyltransferase [Anaeromusa acidaminophila]
MLASRWKLRPMEEADLLVVLTWRNKPSIRAAMYTEHEISLEEHKHWFYKTQQKGYCGKHFVFCCDDIPLGVVNFTAISQKHRRLNWGFYLGVDDAPRGSALVMGFLALQEAFERMEMHKVVGEVLEKNEKSFRYHQRLGFLQEGCLKGHIFKEYDGYLDVVCFGYLIDYWTNIKDSLIAEIREKYI